jgi:hypothetical protein
MPKFNRQNLLTKYSNIKKKNEMIHSEQIKVVPEPKSKSNSNDLTTMLSITIIYA